MSSCNPFLDEMPDKRINVDTEEEVQRLLVDGYPKVHPMGMLEFRTDNVADNGIRFQVSDVSKTPEESYRQEDLTDVAHESSDWMWDLNVESILTANQALDFLKKMPETPRARAIRGEALVMRAWLHFRLVNYFAQAYNKVTSSTDLGVPYWTEPERRIGETFTRLTVEETYKRIRQDLEEGLPLVSDDYLKTGTERYHFNQRAAYAFATQFYLYMEEWQKAKECADFVLGADPSQNLRNFDAFKGLTNDNDIVRVWVSNKEKANLLILPFYSLYGRIYDMPFRYQHTRAIASETFNSVFPGGSSLGKFDPLGRQYNNNPDAVVFIIKYGELFQLTNKRAQTGTPWVVAMPYTMEKVLLWRAEANNMLGLSDEVLRDLNYYYVSKGGNSATLEQISQTYNVPVGYENDASLSVAEKRRYQTLQTTIAKPLEPRFGLAAGIQYNLAQAILHARRVETIFEGDRWDDIKRYRIEIVHKQDNAPDIVLAKDDPRRALQIPATIISAGMTPNPR